MKDVDDRQFLSYDGHACQEDCDGDCADEHGTPAGPRQHEPPPINPGVPAEGTTSDED